MDDPCAMDGVDALGHLCEHAQRPRHVAIPASHVAQRGACLDELHHQEDEAALGDVDVDDRHHVRVIHVRDDLRLARESRSRLGVAAAGERLQCEVLAVGDALDLIDGAHAARAELLDHAVSILHDGALLEHRRRRDLLVLHARQLLGELA